MDIVKGDVCQAYYQWNDGHDHPNEGFARALLWASCLAVTRA